jgi:hypothetical protein
MVFGDSNKTKANLGHSESPSYITIAIKEHAQRTDADFSIEII